MANQDQLDKLDEYLLGRLAENERVQLEQALAKDEELVQLLESRKSVLAAFKHIGNNKLKNKLKGFQAEKEKQIRQKKMVGFFTEKQFSFDEC